jgi:hypothetical protein
MWQLYEEDGNNCWLEETNQRLEVQSRSETDEWVVAAYISNSWKLDVTSDFSFKANFHWSLVSSGVSAVLIGLTPNPSDFQNKHVQFEAACDMNQPDFFYQAIDGSWEDSNWTETRTIDDGTLYVSYGAIRDELYLSYTGYGREDAWASIPDLLQGRWAGDPIYVVIGGGSVQVELNSGNAYLDNFIVESGTVVEGQAPILLEEDFDDGDHAGWSIVDQGDNFSPSNWSAATGTMVQSSNIFSVPVGVELTKLGTYAWYTAGAGWTDYRTTLTISSDDNDAIGFMFRYQDDNNYYRFSWDKQRKYRRLVKKVNGVISLLAEDNVPYVAGQDYQLEVTAQDSTLQVHIDGTSIFSVTDSSLSSGTIALYCWGNRGGNFDDILVENLSGDNLAPVISSCIATPTTISDEQTSQLQVAASDPDSGPSSLTYNWTVQSGEGSLTNAATATPTYDPPDVTSTETFTLTVEVYDGEDTATDTIDVTVTDANGLSYLLEENFDDGDYAGWSIVDQGDQQSPSNWSAATGTMVQSSNIFSVPVGAELTKLGTYAWYTDGAGWTDYRTTLTISSDDDDAIGLMFRYQNENNYYRFSWDKQRKYRRLVKKVNGVISLLAEDNVPYVAGQDYQLKVTAQDSTLQVHIDGTSIFSVTDSSLSSGTIALYCWGNKGGYFDDVSVENLSGVNLAPVISSCIATPSTIYDNETSSLEVVASDPDSGPSGLTYNWTVQADEGSLANATTATPIYDPPDVTSTETFTLTVEVYDGEDTATDTVDVTVTDANGLSYLLEENFDDGDYTGWSVVDQANFFGPSNWSAATGTMVQSSNIYSVPVGVELTKLGTYAWYTAGAGWTDYRTTLMISSDDNDAIGFMFRYQDDNNYYRFSWDKQRKYRRLVKKVNGVISLLAEDNVPYVAGQDYQLEVTAQDSTLQVHIEGTSIFSVTDSSLSSGTIALYCWGNEGGYFDEIMVQLLLP